MKIKIPDFCLIALVGTTGSGKSTFARRHFLATETISSDACRGVVNDDETDQGATADAFDLVHYIAEKRLKRRKLVVVDATNVKAEDRAHLVALARKHHALALAIVLNPGDAVCHERNKDRPNRQFGPHVIRNQTRALKRGIKRIGREGFRYVYEFRSTEDIEAVEIERQPTWTDRRRELGPFDIIGDVHGCCDELEELLAKLGYGVAWTETTDGRQVQVTAPEGRRAIFVGDLVDRGPRSPDALRIVMSMVKAGSALAVPGNHDVKFLRWLNGRNVRLTHGLESTTQQMAAEPSSFRDDVRKFIDGLISHQWLDEGRLAVAHAGIREEMIGRASGAVRSFCLYGETTGETDEFGLPIRYNWAAEYRGKAMIVYGHTPVPEAEWLNNTICLDTGCCFGGKLTALRYPERELVQVPAAQTYAEPIRPLAHPDPRPGALTAQQAADDLLDIEQVLGKSMIKTRLGRTITIHEANAASALEAMTRFAVSPKWLIYLPPTMSPTATSEREGYLEHPDEAFDYFAGEGVSRVVCEEKHMGSRAVIVVCRSAEVATKRFGITSGEIGTIYSRTGRGFFVDAAMTKAALARTRDAFDKAGLWDEFQTDWAIIDAEIMPWSAKAMGLIRDQYAATGAAAELGVSSAVCELQRAAEAGLAVDQLLSQFLQRSGRVQNYLDAYRRYCWPVATLEDYRIAPFHLLASEDAVHMDHDNAWHMKTLARLADEGDPLFMATNFHVVELADEASRREVTQWWQDLTGAGGEGMVVKPYNFVARGPRGLVQPAVKCRGREYLRIIYGPEYDVPDNLERLRKRGLGKKRSLALREFVLGHEALSRFVEREPLRLVHECTFGILALESEPVDPRL